METKKPLIKRFFISCNLIPTTIDFNYDPLQEKGSQRASFENDQSF